MVNFLMGCLTVFVFLMVLSYIQEVNNNDEE